MRFAHFARGQYKFNFREWLLTHEKRENKSLVKITNHTGYIIDCKDEVNTQKPYLPEKKTVVVLKTLVLERAWVPSLVLGNKAGYNIALFPGHVLFTCGVEPLYSRHHLEPIFCPL